jgi:hypothetical protein
MLLLKSQQSDYTTRLLKCQQKSSAQPILFDCIPRRGGLGAVFVLFIEQKSGMREYRKASPDQSGKTLPLTT